MFAALTAGTTVLSSAAPRTNCALVSLRAEVDAEASMLIIAKKTQDVTPKVTNLGIRCAVWPLKKIWLSVPLSMGSKFTYTNHIATYSFSTNAQR